MPRIYQNCRVVLLALCLLFVSACAKNGVSCDDADAYYSSEALLAYDPAVSVPNLKVAISANDSHAVMLTWLLGHNDVTRKMALKYFLRLETEDASYYMSIIDELYTNRDERIREIGEVWADIDGASGGGRD